MFVTFTKKNCEIFNSCFSRRRKSPPEVLIQNKKIPRRRYPTKFELKMTEDLGDIND